MLEFAEFPKMARLNRECVITEKLDGTNAQVYIVPKIQLEGALEAAAIEARIAMGDAFELNDSYVLVGSRNRWITPRDDNYGFARWAFQNREELIKLGPGRHFGEWWGAGIQRGYDMKRKAFSLFDTRWLPVAYADTGVVGSEGVLGPNCVGVVPTLYRGLFTTEAVSEQIERLRTFGSVAQPGYMNPEGVVVFHLAARVGFKVTVKNDDKAKGQL